jgi:formate hydrogenlyase subunit 3/multisubunit Na+/H+ antiporter MnhD subunit
VEYTRVEASVKRYKKTSKMKKVAKARRALFLLATLADILLCGFLPFVVCVCKTKCWGSKANERTAYARYRY